MKKASKVLIGVLSVGALIGTGFAAWTINKGYTKAEAPGFTPDVIVNNNSSFGKFIVTQVEEKNEAGEIVSPIKFDAPREVYNNGQKLPFDPGEEDLEVTYNLRAESDNGHPVDPYTLGSVNRHAYDGIATEYIPDVSISTKVVDAQKQEVSAEVLAEIKEYVALPEDVSQRQMQIPYEKWLAADKKETGYDHTLRFGWGSLTHGENPQLYFIKEENKVEGKDLSESFEAYINKLNEVVKTSGIQFVFTFEIGGVEIFEANTSLISIVEGLGADLHVTHEGQEVKNGDELEIGAVVNVSASALEGYENPVITFNGKVIEAGEVTIVKGANEFGVTATKITEPVDPTEKVFSGTLNGQSIDLEDVKAADSNDKAVYKLTLAIGDKVAFKYGDDVLGFYHWDNEANKAVKDGEEFIATKAGEHTFYINSDNQIYVGEPAGPVEPVENPTYYLAGEFSDWAASEDYILNEVEGVYHFELTIAAGKTAEFKVLGPNNAWYGEETLNGGENFEWANNENHEVKIDIAFYPEKNADGKYIVASLVQGETPVDPVLSVEYYLTGKINGEAKWYDSEGVALTDLVKMDAPQDEKNLAEKLELSLKEGDEIKGIIVNKEDDVVKSVIWRGVDPSEQNVDGSNYVVPKDGKYNFYLTSTALYVTEVEETPVEVPGDGTVEHPYNVDELMEFISSDAEYASKEVTVEGIVYSNTSYNSNYKNYDAIWLKSSTKMEAFELYHVSIEGVEAEANALVGYKIKATGKVKKYNSTYEFEKPTVLSCVAPEGELEATILAAQASATALYVGDKATITVTNDLHQNVTDAEIKVVSGEDVIKVSDYEVEGLKAGTGRIEVSKGNLVKAYIDFTVNEKVSGTTVEFTVESVTTNTTAGEQKATLGDVTLKFENGVFRTDDLRLYKGANATISSEYDILQIEIKCSSSNPASNLGDLEGLTKNGANAVWKGKQKSITFNASAAQVRFTSIKVTYAK